MESPGLQELVDAPRERLEVEYKTWPDPTERETGAKLARHLCALANFGGGFLVFGIHDDMTPAGPRPAATGPYDQDTPSHFTTWNASADAAITAAIPNAAAVI